jgi:DNA-binding LacI/PurR family transcriptional regulator
MPASPRHPPPIRSTADFARYVGLARTTVSRVLNRHPGVKRKTVERVQRALEETGFTPNAFAVHLRGKGSAQVGICMENLFTPPMVLKLAALQKRLRQQGLTCFIEVHAPGEIRRVVQHFLAMQAGAVVFIGQFDPTELAARISELRLRGVAHLVIDQSAVPEANTVTLDRVGAMREVVDHLFALGHCTFGLLGMSSSLQSILDRRQGIVAALTAHRLDPDRCLQCLDHLEARANDFSFGRAIARAFASRPDRPTAFLAVNDATAIGAMVGFQEAGLCVPADLSIVGFNNQEICLMSNPTMSSVDQQIDATIDAAAEMILGQIGKPVAESVVRTIPSQFVERGSTGRAPRH